MVSVLFLPVLNLRCSMIRFFLQPFGGRPRINSRIHQSLGRKDNTPPALRKAKPPQLSAVGQKRSLSYTIPMFLRLI